MEAVSITSFGGSSFIPMASQPLTSYNLQALYDDTA